MAVEWKWLRHQVPVRLPDDGLKMSDGKDYSVILFHGLTGTPSEFAYIAHYLNRRSKFSVWCPRLVNHGQPLAILACTRWRQLLNSARAYVEEASREARLSGQSLVVGGLSLGAILALMLGAEMPEEIAGVICLSPTLFYDGWNVPWIHKLLPFIDYTPLKYFAYYREEPPFGLKDEILRKKIAAQYETMSLRDSGDAAALGYAHFPVRLFCEARHLITKCIRELPRMLAPLLLVQAENDEATSPRNSQFIHQRVGSKQKEIIMLQDSYHVVTADLERARVAAEIERFCHSVAVPGRGASACDTKGLLSAGQQG
ncbi:MAG TPA: alpha/beta fold hydrolase [Burkholderiales bacterium]|nr:alpha/beta fold hydrolase [Burkholderiales bacterium]